MEQNEGQIYLISIGVFGKKNMGGNMAYRKEKQQEISKFQIILKLFVDIAIVAGIAAIFSISLGEKFTVVGYSMEKSLTNGEEALINKLIYHFKQPERFDIVVFCPKEEKDKRYVKRIIGLPGETIQIISGRVYINGEILEEPIETEKMLNAGLAQEPITLGENEYFLLGDNRNNSEDSRYESVGNIKIDNIVGKLWLRITTLNDIGWIE